ncbi:hypothetical protein ElyMa_006154200 [Elysia marginata]|uniref:Uncharacterized protein n=1 Tax=Elysia marginata TaxID=1093978 RepID=A0AAV4H245_9GAST|nr:hypothetical protein ElyMa_006154200 [Elysia marginata]
MRRDVENYRHVRCPATRQTLESLAAASIAGFCTTFTATTTTTTTSPSIAVATAAAAAVVRLLDCWCSRAGLVCVEPARRKPHTALHLTRIAGICLSRSAWASRHRVSCGHVVSCP